MMELKKDGTCNTIIALLGAGKENCYRPERPIQVPLFDESGENVEDKRKREKEEAARIAAAAEESRGRGEAAKSHLREPDKKRKRAERGRQIQKCLVATGQSTRSGSGRSFEPNTQPGKRNQEFERSQQSDQTADRLVWKDSGRIITNYITLI